MKNNVWEYMIKYDPLVVIRQKHVIDEKTGDIKDYKSQRWASGGKQKWWDDTEHRVFEVFTFGDFDYDKISELGAYKEMKKFMKSIGKDWTIDDMNYLK